MSINSASISSKVIIKWLVCIALAILPLLVPTSESYTQTIKLYLFATLFGIALLAFDLLSGYIIIFLVSAVWILTGVTSFEGALASWASSTAVMMISAYCLIAILQRTGLINRIGYKVILLAGGSFTGLSWGLFFCSIIIAQIGFGMCALLIFVIAFALYKALDLHPGDKETTVILMTVMVGGIQFTCFVYAPISLSVLQASVSAVLPDYVVSFLDIMYYNWPIVILGLLFEFGLLKWYKHASKNQNLNAEKGKEYFRKKYEEMGSMTSEEKKGAIALIICIAILLTQPLHNLDSAFAFLIALIILYLPGINVGKAEDINQVPWDSIVVVLGCLSIGTIGTEVGLGNLLGQALLPVISGLGSYWSVLGTFIMGGLVNFVLTPFSMLAMLPPIIGNYCLASGFDFTPHLYAMYISRDFVFLPYEYVAYLMLYSFGMCKMGKMIKLMSIKSVIYFVFFVAVMMPFWHFALGLM